MLRLVPSEVEVLRVQVAVLEERQTARRRLLAETAAVVERRERELDNLRGRLRAVEIEGAL
jgi:hypothetical protein